MSPTRDERAVDPGLTKALLGHRMSRRDLLRYTGMGVGAALLAACQVGGTKPTPTGATGATQPPATLPLKSGKLVMANWPLYIDKAKGRSPTLDQFRQEFGIATTYTEAINDNEEFFGTDLREPLSQGQPTGWDIIVMTDWMIAKLIRLGWLEPLHHDALPNVQATMAEKFRDPYYDQDNTHSVPWAAGITGIGYNRALAGRDIASFDDLFDPELAGRVGLFSEMRDTFGLTLLSMGINPQNATVEDVEAAQQKLLQHRDNIRGFYGNDYADQLAQGNLVASMAWSGDVFALKLDNPDLEFVIPEAGGMRWTDNMCIPKGAEDITDAHLFIDFVYRPEIAQQITEWVWYESPVEGIQELIAGHAEETGDEILAELAASPLVFPTPETVSQIHGYRVLDEEEEEVWRELFQELVQG